MRKLPGGRYDVVVVGGGVIGCAVAYFVARRGLKVLLVERAGLGSGASGANPGFLVLSYRESPLALQMAREVLMRLPELERELDIGLQAERTGGLIPVKNTAEEQAVAAVIDQAQRWGLSSARMVTSREAVELEPRLDPGSIVAAGYCADEGRINPFRLVYGLACGCQRLGATLWTHAPVRRFHLGTGPLRRVEAVETEDGRIAEAGVVVVAAGAWTRELVRMAGLELAICYERGEAMVTERTGPLVRGIITDGEFFVGYRDNRNLMRTGACLTQTSSGNVVVAQATTEVDGYDIRNTYQGLREVAAKAARYFPALAPLQVIRCWAAVTPYTPDGQPALGFLRDVPNLLVAASFHSAVGLAPAVGQVVSDLIVDGRANVDLTPWSPERLWREGGWSGGGGC